MTKTNHDAEDLVRFSAFSFSISNNMIEVTAQNYTSLAGKTERVPTDNKDMDPTLSVTSEAILRAAIQVGAQVDRLKRVLIYGKQDNLTEALALLPNVKVEQVVGDNVTMTPEQFRLLHAALGMITEAAEFAETVANHIFKGVPIDPINLKEEIGDMNWYQALPMNIYGWKLESILQMNIDKLAARYPEGFTEEKALNRNLETERKVMEGTQPPTT